jgi:hypothetical protein
MAEPRGATHEWTLWVVAVSCALRLFGSVDQAEIDNLDTWALELCGDLTDIAREALAQSFELRPIGIQSDAEETDAQRGYFRRRHMLFVIL